jgi:stage II sporulation protein D
MWVWMAGAYLMLGSTAASPSGLDLLYTDRVAFGTGGQPKITLGLVEGRQSIRLHSNAPMQLDFYEGGVFKRSNIPKNKILKASLLRSTPASQRFYVQVAAVRWKDRHKLPALQATWQAKGYTKLELLQEGAVMGMGGSLMDTRRVRLILPTEDLSSAQALATQLYSLHGIQATTDSQLLERPWGEIKVEGAGESVGVATTFIRLRPSSHNPEAAITIEEVEYGQGYAWQGKEARSYLGELYIVIDPTGTLSVVNVLGAEEILKGVVPSEIFATAPTEALKAQAVAARNHLLAQLGTRHHGQPYHLCGQQHCQVYTGLKRRHQRTDEAVNSTAGQVLFHSGQLVHATYSSTCGGFTENKEVVWGGEPDPALKAKPDFDSAHDPALIPFVNGIQGKRFEAWLKINPKSFCAQGSTGKTSKVRWHRHFDHSQIQKITSAQHTDIGSLMDISVTDRGPGGRAIGLRLTGSKTSHMVLMELPIRRLFNNLPSGSFIIDTQKDKQGKIINLNFHGAGWGHGVGMCQLGAIGRAKAGQGYRRILHHYYNGAQLKKIYEQHTPSP